MSDSEEEKKNQGSDMKFDELMKAAVSVKTNQLAQKKKFFESLPTFLQAGVYYTKKQQNIRKQRFHQKLFVYEILKKDAKKAFKVEDHNRACRKYEEALCIWRYYYCTNPEWEKEGIEDSYLKHHEEKGDNSDQIFKIREMKITMYTNIALCSLKFKDFKASLCACDEAIKLDSNNVKGYFLRARSRILDINSGVDELKIAIRDLKEGLRIDPNNKPIIRELQKIMKLVNIQSKKEKETYLSMFDNKNSVEDYVKKTIKDDMKSEEKYIQKIDQIMPPIQKKVKEKFEKKVANFMKSKELEFSYEVKKEKVKIPEIEEIRSTIEKGEETITLYLKAGKIAEAKQVKKSLQQARYEIEMLD